MTPKPESDGVKLPEKPERHTFDCGECWMCSNTTYNGDNPDTHCIDCTCLFCIPGG